MSGRLVDGGNPLVELFGCVVQGDVDPDLGGGAGVVAVPVGVGNHLWWPRPRFELELLGLGVAGGEQIGARLVEAAQVP